MSQGHSAAWDHHWDQAIAAYSEALTLVPDDWHGLTSLGFALLQTNRLPEALKCYQRAASISPGELTAPEKCGEVLEALGRRNQAGQTYVAVAEAYIRRREIQKAIENWERAVRLLPDHVGAHSHLAMAAERTGRTALAVQHYLEAARIYQQSGESDKALTAASRAQEIDPASPEPPQALARLQRGEPLAAARQVSAAGPAAGTAIDTSIFDDQAASHDDAASAASQAASPLAASQARALSMLADLLFEAETDADRAPASIGEPTSITGQLTGDRARRTLARRALSQAIDFQSKGDTRAAIQNYRAALDAGLESPVAELMIGALHFEARRPAEAVSWFERAANHEVVGAGALYGLGLAEHQEGRASQALTHLLELLRRLDRGLVREDQREALDEAYENLVSGMEVREAHSLAPLVTALLDLLSGDGWEERLRQARRQLDDGSQDGTPTPLADLLAMPAAGEVVDSLRRIEAHMARQMWATAMEEAYFALGQSPSLLPIHVRMAEILTAENKQQAAIAKYLAVAETYRSRGQPFRAARIMEQALRLTPMDIPLRRRLIQVLVEQGKMLQAVQQQYDLADTYYRLTDLAAARAILSEALALAERHVLGTEWRVRLLHMMGDIDLQQLNLRSGLRIYEQIRDLAPDDHTGRSTLIDLLFRLDHKSQALAEVDNYLRRLLEGGQLATAVSLLEEVTQSQPDELPLLARQARLSQDAGQRLLAITQYDRLAELQIVAGQMRQAAETIQSLLSLDPPNSERYASLLNDLQSQY
jgi:tetratricopeptide (TPR) repeat protein